MAIAIPDSLMRKVYTNTSRSFNYNRRALSFESGYSQRQPIGVTPITQSCTLEFRALDDFQRTELRQLLDTGKGIDQYRFPYPGETVAQNWMLEGNVTETRDFGKWTISVSFKSETAVTTTTVQSEFDDLIPTYEGGLI